MEDKNRLNTVRTDRYMTPLEVEIAAANLRDVELSLEYRRSHRRSTFDHLLTYGLVIFLGVFILCSLISIWTY